MNYDELRGVISKIHMGRITTFEGETVNSSDDILIILVNHIEQLDKSFEEKLRSKLVEFGCITPSAEDE